MNMQNYMCSETDFFVGRRGQLKRYLVCSLQGYFPVLVKTGARALSVIYRTGGTHVSLSATLAVSNSMDGGVSWSDPLEIAPRWSDARNPALGINNKGELIAAYWTAREIYDFQDGHVNAIGNRKGQNLNNFFSKSADGGRTWSKPQKLHYEHLCLGQPYGRIITAPDGTLLMSIYGIPTGDDECKKNRVCLIRSRDGGDSWSDETIVAEDFNETSFSFMPDGTLVAAARNWSQGAFVATLFSNDGGYTWSDPQQITRAAEHPADLTLLQSGRLLMTFGRRRRPMGCGALISEDFGKTWQRDREILLAGDGIRNGDLGYPSTVQLDDGTIVTVMYYACGSSESSDGRNWGDISCQALHYHEEDIHGF